MPKLTDFINTIGNYGVARNNKFEVILPSSIDGIKNSIDVRMVSLYAESVDIPGKLINTIPTRIQNKTYEMPAEFMYSDTLNITFLVDTKLQVRDYFESWLNLVSPHKLNTSFGPNMPSLYTLNSLTLNVVDNVMQNGASGLTPERYNPFSSLTTAFNNALGGKRSSTPAATMEVDVGKFIFTKVYPKRINGLQLSNTSKDFQRLHVAFAFDVMLSAFTEANSRPITRPGLTQGTGTGLLGALNGIAGNIGGTIGGVVGQASRIGSNLTGVLGL